MTTFLITGGFGRFLYKHFGGIGFDRNMPLDKFEDIRREDTDVIIHCASQPPRTVTSSSLYSFIDDNVLLTERVVGLRHKKFVFISSADVYPKTNISHNEEEDISLGSIANFYAASKLMSESIVMKTCPNYLILRCVALLGAHSRQNSLIKISEEASPVLTLSSDSIMNYVRHSQVADFIKYAAKNDLRGVYNVASTENITLGRVADLLKKKVRFGSHPYRVSNISNRKISSVFPSFKRTSEDIVHQFIKEDLPKRKTHTKIPIE
jgi:nucleoside-diphosphate-sugar epimerase